MSPAKSMSVAPAGPGMGCLSWDMARELNKHGITAIAETVAVAYRRSLALCVFMFGWSVEELGTVMLEYLEMARLRIFGSIAA